jgi:hypothetical protein
VKMTSALRYFGLLMLIGMLITGFRVGWTPALVNFTGLLIDITGASLLIISIMSRPATYFRITKGLVRGDRTFLQWWVRDFPLALAATFGSKDTRDSQPSMEEDLKDNVWGLLLLLLGFGLQALAVWAQASQ